MKSCTQSNPRPQRRGRCAAGWPRVALGVYGVCAALLALIAAGAVGAKGPTCGSASTCREVLSLRTGGFVRLYRNVPLEADPSVGAAVVVIHGNSRDADRYFEKLLAAARLEGRSADVALLAPNFRTLKDELAAKEHFWSHGGWKIGNRSRDKDQARVSSFGVVDELLGLVCGSDRSAFPALERVVVIGHSAGGQFVNRYAAGGAGCTDAAVEVRYVVMNPSSYMYLDGRRYSKETDGFRVPETSCEDYNEYKYGTEDLNSYMTAVGLARIRENLFRRRVYYLAGDADTKLGGSLDESCRGNLQGPQRLKRFENYRSYRELFEDWTGSVFETVPGVGHSGSKMLKSEPARRVMFR